MTCRYCRAANSEGDSRCRRCGRRLDAADSSYSETPYAHAATAPALHERTAGPAPESRQKPEFVSMPGGATGRRKKSWQPSLFGMRDLGRVVSLDELSGTRTQRPRREAGASKTRARKPVAGQQDLLFAEGPAATPRPHTTAPPATGVIWCDAPVAIAAHRLGAAGLDLLMVGAAMALFIGIVYLLTGAAVLEQIRFPMLAGIGGVFVLLYQSLWCLAGGDSLGMRLSQLRTVTFDGRVPEREQRFSRLAATCLSVLAMGLGLLWSLVDEEALAWHDHISRTFPTPYPAGRRY